MRKKRLLVVAPGLPEFDRNAGSRRLYSWLRILAIEYDIAFYMLQRRISADSNRYAQALRELGVKIHAPRKPCWSCWPGRSIMACYSSSFTRPSACSRICDSCAQTCRWSCPVRTSTTFESLARPSMPIIR